MAAETVWFYRECPNNAAMNELTIEQALEQTLADYRLTRGEKRALAGVIEPFADDEHRLTLARGYAFQRVREELERQQDRELIDWLEAVVKVLLPPAPPTQPAIPAEAFFSPDDACVARIVRLFDSARRSADVCVYTITDDRIKHAILAAHHRQVAVRIISDNEKSDDRGSDVNQLANIGVPVRVDRSEHHMHHKYAIFDQKRLLTGSYNWTRSAAENNEENFIVTGDDRLLKAFCRAFDDLWEQLG
jgi:phosphatidylserine/phosphatidylglycerophosphate/cardiolipin synthase-like enzyme